MRISIMLLALSWWAALGGAERRPIADVSTDTFTSETQVTPSGAGDNHVSILWWIPHEFWESILARDTTTSEHDKQAMLDAMNGVSLLAVVQADVSNFGAFTFYPKEEVERHLVISVKGGGEAAQKLTPLTDLKPELEVVLNVFKPILGNAMGNMGDNMHFYVLADRDGADQRILDPYEKGEITMQLKTRGKQTLTGAITLPLDALYVPRLCPNGRPAHISWRFCPWTGEKLAD